jgi:8-oxo-dGTP pyrophosphatase MutT (NUDIX family)
MTHRQPPAELTRLVKNLRTGAAFDGLRPPPTGGGRPSAVLIVFAPVPSGEGLGLLLIERSAQLRNHAGQVAFPGGSVDPEDADHIATALREAQEEVGVDPAEVLVLAELPPVYIWRTGFVVTPVLAWWPRPGPVAPVDVGEVARTALVPLATLVDPANRFTVRHPSGLMGPGFAAEGLFVWGFTALVLDTLLQAAGWSVPWDERTVRDLPG